jgi:molecular chaperone DnaK (HSP70)
MKLIWKRIIDGKRIQFECDFILNGKVNYENVCLSKNDIEKEYLIESVQSVIEEYFFDKQKKRAEIVKQNDALKDEKTKVRNHFRNVCFRKKFNTIKEHIKYVANYYKIDDMKVMSYVEDDLPIIKKQVGLN